MCTLEHLEVWGLTSRLLPRFVEATEFVVYVPEFQVDKFLEVTDSAVTVLSEDLLGEAFSCKLRNAVRATGNLSRYGWYLQQFNKIEALLQSDCDSLVIWDADCVPVHDIELFDEKGRPVYMNATEFNANYFESIDKLLGLSKIRSESFIVPSFPIYREWVRDLISYIEMRFGGLPWYDAIIASTDLSLGAGFSEFETLGTWVSHKYPESWTTGLQKWERFGQSRFGYAQDLTADQLVNIGENAKLDLISFESWDRPSVRNHLRNFINRIV